MLGTAFSMVVCLCVLIMLVYKVHQRYSNKFTSSRLGKEESSELNIASLFHLKMFTLEYHNNSNNVNKFNSYYTRPDVFNGVNKSNTIVIHFSVTSPHRFISEEFSYAEIHI
jgi:hypothetical protein